jgi:1-acyl-sn-glycerol-3-phosphate acyltransferase
MAYFRTVCIVLTLLFFVFVTPFQIVAMRFGFTQGAWAQRMFCRALLFILRVHVDRSGDPAQERPRLVVANHVSWIDILVFASMEPLSFLAKSEVGSWPVIASFAKAQQTVFVDRTRRRSIPAANRSMAQKMSAARSVLLFPEGTTHDGVTLGKFHSSHLAAARDLLAVEAATPCVFVQPAAIAYSSPLAAWVGEATLLPHLWDILKAPPMRAQIVYCEPLRFTRGDDRKSLCAIAKCAIEDALTELRGEEVAPLEQADILPPEQVAA